MAPTGSATQASGASSGRQPAEALDEALRRAGFPEKVQSAIRVILDEYLNRAEMRAKGEIYRKDLTNALNSGNMDAAGVALANAATEIYGRYENPYYRLDQFHSKTGIRNGGKYWDDPDSKAKDAILNAEIAIIGQDAEGRNRINRELQPDEYPNFLAGGFTTVNYDSYVNGLKAVYNPSQPPPQAVVAEAQQPQIPQPSQIRTPPVVGDVEQPHPHPASPGFDSDLRDIDSDINAWVASFQDARLRSVIVPAAALIANNPAIKAAASRSLREKAERINEINLGFNGEAIRVGYRDLHPNDNPDNWKAWYFQNNQGSTDALAEAIRAGRLFPQLMTEIIADDAKVYSGNDLRKVNQAVGDLIAPNIRMPRVDANNHLLTNRDGSMRFMSEAEIRAQVAAVIERIHTGNADQDAEDWLRAAITKADNRVLGTPQPHGL